MTSSLESELSELLEKFSAGDTSATGRLLVILSSELHKLAEHCMHGQPPDHTLQATALVNEAYLRLSGTPSEPCKNRKHFLALAAKAMRCVLIDHARTKNRDKRAASGQRLALDQIVVSYEEHAFGLVELDQALELLCRFDPRMAKAVELRFFGGLSMEETAELVGLSLRSFERDWAAARAWLYLEVLG